MSCAPLRSNNERITIKFLFFFRCLGIRHNLGLHYKDRKKCAYTKGNQSYGATRGPAREITWDPDPPAAERPINAPPGDRSFGRSSILASWPLAFYNIDMFYCLFRDPRKPCELSCWGRHAEGGEVEPEQNLSPNVIPYNLLFLCLQRRKYLSNSTYLIAAPQLKLNLVVHMQSIF